MGLGLAHLCCSKYLCRMSISMVLLIRREVVVFVPEKVTGCLVPKLNKGCGGYRSLLLRQPLRLYLGLHGGVHRWWLHRWLHRMGCRLPIELQRLGNVGLLSWLLWSRVAEGLRHLGPGKGHHCRSRVINPRRRAFELMCGCVSYRSHHDLVGVRGDPPLVPFHIHRVSNSQSCTQRHWYLNTVPTKLWLIRQNPKRT